MVLDLPQRTNVFKLNMMQRSAVTHRTKLLTYMYIVSESSATPMFCGVEVGLDIAK